MLKVTLNKLFRQMEAFYPNARRDALKGLSKDEIARIEEENGIILSPPIKALYETVNGFYRKDNQQSETPFLFPLLIGNYFLVSLEEALEMRWNFLRGQGFDEYTGNWLPVFEDTYAQCFWLLVDIESKGGTIIEYASEYWEGYERRTVFPSLNAMFTYMGTLLSNGCCALDADGELQVDYALALQTGAAMFDLPYWKEHAEESAEHEQRKKWLEEGGIELEQAMASRALIQESRTVLENKLRDGR